jgi:hypothetical protein
MDEENEVENESENDHDEQECYERDESGDSFDAMLENLWLGDE